MDSIKTGLDHILLGINNLDHGVDWVEEKTGVRAAFGGVHPGRGTRNALLNLGLDCYLKIIAPDPEQASPTWFSQIHGLEEPRLLTWAVHTTDFESLAQSARVAGIPIEGPHDGARTLTDGKDLHWKLFHLKENRDGLLPFFIEWGKQSIHPAIHAPAGCGLREFYLQSPEAPDLIRTCELLGVAVSISPADKPGLHAVISSPKGIVELTS